ADLSSAGGPADGQVSDSIFQEIDLRTGRLLLEWRSLDHIPITESYKPMGLPYDYLHLNSIQILPDGNFLVSARHTWALYKLDRRTGQVIWKLGGKRSNFAMGPDAQFAWQHDARAISDTQITIFDNQSDGPNTNQPQSRGLILNVDNARRSVTVHRSFHHPQSLLASAMGNVQMLPNGHVFIGWGLASHATEYTAEGTLVSDAQLPPKMYSYRVYRSEWRGTPADPPAVAAERDARTGKSTIYVSWNGSTEVDRWQVHAGHRRRHLMTLGVAPRQGFETAIPVGRHPFVAVTALDRFGRRLARSHTVRT
ncbi:MAG TPA: arylsulfotransferase family protein, partial [Solirubrobacteraceae bacterium]|nr:arylsulfotransferase family protein [Solirubrobacteraceae bacterium]